MFLSVSVRRLCGGYSHCGTSAGPPDFVVQNYRKLFNRPNYTYYYIRHLLFFLMSCGLWNTFCLFLISFSHRYTFHSACRHDISFPRHLSVPALIPSSPRAHVRQRRQHHLSVPALIPSSPRAPVRQRRQHHLSVPALIPSSPFWPMKPVLSKSYTLRFRTASRLQLRLLLQHRLPLVYLSLLTLKVYLTVIIPEQGYKIFLTNINQQTCRIRLSGYP